MMQFSIKGFANIEKNYINDDKYCSHPMIFGNRILKYTHKKKIFSSNDSREFDGEHIESIVFYPMGNFETIFIL